MKALWVSVVTILATLVVTAEEGVKLEPANFKIMLRGYCFAGSVVRDKQAPGGFGTSDNIPIEIEANLPSPKVEVYLLALPAHELPFAKKYRGMKLLLINGTDKVAEFPASDSRLSIVSEAKDADGTWKPVEYLPQSWCGNSRHRVFLGAKEFWQFAAPKYEGSVKTVLRFKFQMDKDRILYSNEFEGSINPDQFTAKQGYSPNSIMDPYND